MNQRRWGEKRIQIYNKLKLNLANLANDSHSRTLPTYASLELSTDRIENETYKFETNTGKLMYKQFNKTTGLLL